MNKKKEINFEEKQRANLKDELVRLNDMEDELEEEFVVVSKERERLNKVLKKELLVTTKSKKDRFNKKKRKRK